jgi:urocanate hydratase
MCAVNTTGISPGSCFISTPNVMSITQQECEDSIKIELFSDKKNSTNVYEGYEPRDWICVNWTALKA